MTKCDFVQSDKLLNSLGAPGLSADRLGAAAHAMLPLPPKLTTTSTPDDLWKLQHGRYAYSIGAAYMKTTRTDFDKPQLMNGNTGKHNKRYHQALASPSGLKKR